MCFQEFVLHTNRPDLDFELGGLINIMSTRDVSGLNAIPEGTKWPRVEQFKPDTSQIGVM